MNFSLPIDPSKLQNARLSLIPLPLCPPSTASTFYHSTNITNPALWHYFPRGPFPTLDSFMSWYTPEIAQDPTRVIFAILLKAGTLTRRVPGSETGGIETITVTESTFAGTTGLTDASAAHSRVEIGFAIVLPQFQRTLVNSTACCLLLKHLLDPVEGGDLGLRRVQWQANSANQASIEAAKRLGFSLEGIMRWQRVVTDNKACVSEDSGERADGVPTIDLEGRKIGPGRHSAMLALCWDDWLEGKRDHVLQMLNR